MCVEMLHSNTVSTSHAWLFIFKFIKFKRHSKFSYSRVRGIARMKAYDVYFLKNIIHIYWLHELRRQETVINPVVLSNSSTQGDSSKIISHWKKARIPWRNGGFQVWGRVFHRRVWTKLSFLKTCENQSEANLKRLPLAKHKTIRASNKIMTTMDQNTTHIQIFTNSAWQSKSKAKQNKTKQNKTSSLLIFRGS